MTKPANANATTELPVANPSAELPEVDDDPRPISLGVRVAALVAIIVPFLGSPGT